MSINKKQIHFMIIGLICLLAVLIVTTKSKQLRLSEVDSPADNVELQKEEPDRIQESISSVDVTPDEQVIEKKSEIVLKAISEPVPENENVPDMDPEEQPREFFVREFDNMVELPDGYTMQDLELTNDGIRLKPAEEGEEDKPRFGILYSPPEELAFSSNAVSPMWKEQIPDDTSIFVEVSVSPDGDNWGLWNPVYPDDDCVGQLNEFYPDGSPNPNYGYIPGGVFFWGMKQYNYFQYRITLYSESEASPLLEGFRLYYQDSTLGDGHVAEVDGNLTPEGDVN
jgi:hypothetical protein